MNTATLWTRQVPDVLKELEQNGRYICRKEYIANKNGNMSDYYLRLYEWYTREARNYIEIPESLHYPIWLSLDEELMLQPTENTVVLKLKIPADRYLVCNMDCWGYRVNYWYVPLDREDLKAHECELKKYGIVNEEDIMLTDRGNFYPLMRRKIQQSWSRVFTIPPKTIQEAVATAWELKEEWVDEVRRY